LHLLSPNDSLQKKCFVIEEWKYALVARESIKSIVIARSFITPEQASHFFVAKRHALIRDREERIQVFSPEVS
jgi:hypothetical protein